MRDVIIIGGGPAGSTLARLIGSKYNVLVLERRVFKNTQDYNIVKSCGGLIAPDAQLMLARFGLGIPKSVIMSPQLFAVRAMDFENSNERYYQRNYINIDRERFDKWLISLIPDKVDIKYNSIYKSYNIDGDGVSVKFTCDGKEYTEKAKIIVGADGGFSKVRRQGFGTVPNPKLYITIQEWFKTDYDLNYYGAIFDREITDFYSWTIPKEEYLIVGSALIPNYDVHEKFNLLKKKLVDRGFKLDNSIKLEGAHLLRPNSLNQVCTGNNKVALVGEAAGFISPSSAEGLSYAFRSSLALSKAFKNGFGGFEKTYKRDTIMLKSNIFLKNMKKPAMYVKPIRNIIMKSGLLSVKIEG